MIKHVIRLITQRPGAYALGLGLALVGPVLQAQEPQWEEVGDVPINAQSLAFDEEDSLWAIASVVWRLPAMESIWLEIYDGPGFVGDEIYPISRDFVLRSGGFISRSTDGGESWDGVWDEGGAFLETDPDGPNAGLLLTGVRDSSGVGYSLDRGASWQRATFAVPEMSNRECYAFLEMPLGHAFEGRLLAGCLGGLAYSDDGGRIWNYSNAWWTFQTECRSLGLGPDGTAYAISGDGPGPGGFFVWASEDGATWEQRAPLTGIGYLTVLPNPSPLGSLLAVSLFEAEGAGVYGSTNGGYSFSLLGRTPVDPTQDFVMDALVGPDGLLYIAVSRAGPEDAWVYRTTEPVVVANEPEVPAPTTQRLIVYPNPATDRLTVEAEMLGGAVLLYDLLGRLVLRARLIAGKAVLDASQLQAGVYVVRVGARARRVAIVK